MKKFSFCTLLLLCFSLLAFSQHCPFDGTMILVIQATEKLKKHDCIIIEETTSYNLEICSYGNGKLKDTLRKKDKSLFLSDSQASYFDEYLKKSPDFTKGAYLLVRSYSSIECVERKKDDKGYEYTEKHIRSFTLKLMRKGKAIKEKSISSKDFYSLCTSSGSWNRIVAINF